MKDFYQRVYELVTTIPPGCVTTYGAIALSLGAKRSSRLVGHALAAADSLGLPCHRVVNRNGELSGKTHFPTPTMMRDLLESEGITFRGEAVDMKKHFWDPETGKRTPR